MRLSVIVVNYACLLLTIWTLTTFTIRILSVCYLFRSFSESSFLEGAKDLKNLVCSTSLIFSEVLRLNWADHQTGAKGPD